MNWELVAESLARPYRVRASMVLLICLIPLYILIPAYFPPGIRYTPELPLDGVIPLVPLWAVVYGALYMFLIMLPVFVVREEELIRRTVYAYLLIWITSYIFFFVVYPTAAPRPDQVTGEGFGVWGLRALYGSDPPYNCFPSLHVAHSFLSALACGRVHRRLGNIALISATLVAVSTLFTKQHYVLDVVAGALLALVAYKIFLRQYPRTRIPDFDRHVAPSLAWCVCAVVAIGLTGYWGVYLWMGETQFEFGP